MNNSVVIKGIKSGLILVLDNNISYEELRCDIIEKFKISADFLGEADIGLTFEGRELTNEQIRDIMGIIHDNSMLNVVCVMTDDPIKDALFEKNIDDKVIELSKNTAVFHTGNIRSGQDVSFDSGVVIVGNVHEGAKVTAKGNVVVLGELLGSVFAGNGNADSEDDEDNKDIFIAALDMKAEYIGIKDKKILYTKQKTHIFSRDKKSPSIAVIRGDDIAVYELTKDVVHELFV